MLIFDAEQVYLKPQITNSRKESYSKSLIPTWKKTRGKFQLVQQNKEHVSVH